MGKVLFLLLALLAQNSNTYLGPNDKNASGLVRIQVLVSDDPDPNGVQIESVIFDGASIPLKPRDINGDRGQGSFQKPAGSYVLKWKIRRPQYDWPRTETKQEKILIDKHDLWVQIVVKGDSATVN